MGWLWLVDKLTENYDLTLVPLRLMGHFSIFQQIVLVF